MRLTREFAEAFAAEWIECWNAHDLERILAHYTDDFEISSPLIIARGEDPSGTLRGKADVRRYWAGGLAAQSGLHFERIAVLLGVDSMSLLYRRHDDRRVVEVFFFGDDGRVTRTIAQYE